MRYGWSIDPQAWSRADSEIQKLEWKKVFLLEHQAPLVPQGSGVYLMCVHPPVSRNKDVPRPLAILYNAIYAGQSRILRDRFKTHAKSTSEDIESAKRAYGNLDFWYAVVDSVDLNHLEALLLDVLGPTANRVNAPLQGKLGAPRPANSEIYRK